MKILAFGIILSLAAFGAEAKIWRVNNGVGASADFTTFAAAHTAAAAGDTIYIEPSGTDYGTLAITKKLVVFGTGYFHGSNNPDSPLSPSRVSTVTINSTASGTVISGFEFTSGSGSTITGTSNIVFSRNKSANLVITGSSNILIYQNYDLEIVMSSTASVNVIISNNVLTDVNITASQGAVVRNNIFTANTIILGQALTSNILVAPSTYYTSTSFAGSGLSNNIDATSPGAAVFGTTNGNKGNILPTNVFVAGTIGSFNLFIVSYDGQYALKSGSPAIATGAGGIDCGIFGGSTPYVLSGLPPIPVITKFSSSITGSNTTPVQIQISVKSNN